MPTKDDLRKNI